MYCVIVHIHHRLKLYISKLLTSKFFQICSIFYKQQYPSCCELHRAQITRGFTQGQDEVYIDYAIVISTKVACGL